MTPPPFAAMGPQFDGFAYFLLVAAIGAAAVWALVFAVRFLASAPKLPDAGPATTELRGEPPAVANLLINRWQLTRVALQATLLDLAARRWLGVEEYVGKNIVVRVRPEPGNDQLTDYERQVLDLVKARATGGSAPAEVLHIGEGGAATSFMKRFNKSVIADVKHRGLARARWAPNDYLVLGAGLAIVAFLFAVAFGQADLWKPEPGASEDSGMTRSDWLFAGLVAWAIGMAGIAALRDLRDTPAGREAAKHWLGVRTYLEESNAFENASPAAVTTWERYMGYATAFGVAHEAAEMLPLAPEEPDVAWSRSTGVWRQIRVAYPVRFGFGEWPLKVFAEGLARTAFFGAIGFVALPIGAGVVFDFVEEIWEDQGTFQADYPWAFRAFLIGFVAFIALLGAILIAQILRGAVRLYRGALDLGRTVVIEGEVVKVYGGRFAVDNGRDLETVAFIPNPKVTVPPVGAKVRVTASPRLKYLSRVEVFGAAPAAPVTEGATAAPAPAAAGSLASLVTAADIEAATGLPLAPTAGRHPLSGTGRFQLFSDDQGNQVQVGEVLTVEPAAVAVGKMFWAAQKFNRAGAPDIPGSVWMGDANLFIKRDDRILVVSVDFAGPQREAERRAAAALAERMLGAEAAPQA
ncbi:MAG: DUF2207 domain-containing protein [Dehalococcoidia bacterium]